MKYFKGFGISIFLFVFYFSSCSKKVDPDTALIRNTAGTSQTTGTGGFNSGNGDDLSLAGDPLLGTTDDLLAPRNSI